MSCIRFRRGSWGVDWRDALGKRQWTKCGSELEAERVRKAVEAERRPVSELGGSELRLREYAEMFFREARVRAKPMTIRTYRVAYRHLAELGELRMAEISRFLLKRHIVKLHESGVGLQMPVKVLSMLFAAAYDDGLIARNPARRLKRLFRLDERAAEPKAFTADELARFLEASRVEPLYDPLFRTMAYAGIRHGEVRALQVRDVDVEGRKLDVRRTFSGNLLSASPKSGRSRRVEIPETLALELEGLTRWREPETWLFSRGKRGRKGDLFLRDTTVRDAFKRALRRARLPERYTPHCLRHSYASLLIQQGARAEYIQRQLGHHSIKLTVDIYGRWLELSAYPELERLVRRTERGSLPLLEEEDDPEYRAHVLSFHRGRALRRPETTRTLCSQRSECDEEHDPDEPA